MWSRKFSWWMCGWILAILLVVAIASDAVRPPPTFSFLEGHRSIRADEYVRGYELSGDAAELSRRIESDLTGQGFKRITDEQWSKGRKAKFRSPDRKQQVFLVSETDQARRVFFWIVTVWKQPMWNTLVSKVRNVLTPTATTRCGGSIEICFANLKQMEGAKAIWAMENPRKTNEVPSDADLFGPQAYIRVKAACPEGGTYFIGKVGEHPHCSIPWHGLQ